MRWENQRLVRDDSQPALPGMPGWVRSVRTPEFAGVTFHEVAARSVLNRLPVTAGLPFRWTVNPYRGCSHACTYCLAGDTPILMADGRARPLAELRVGDRIFGTVRRGRLRRYTVTVVLDHWPTVRPAYRVTMIDGTRLVTSADHRLLTDVGWRFVADVTQRHWPGRQGRPHLRPGSMVVGTGAFAQPPKDSSDYRLGYLCGVIQSGGRPGPFRHSAGGQHRVRLARLGFEALTRARVYLAAAGVATDRFLDRQRPGQRGELLTVRARDGELGEVRRLVRWPAVPSEEWRRGFLSGVYDIGGQPLPEGANGTDTLQLCSEVPEVVAQVIAACRQLGLDAALDGPAQVRILGGLTERLRFLHTVDPASSGERVLTGVVLDADAACAVRSVEPLGLQLPLFDIATGTGDFIANGVVSHNCFARGSHTYLDLDAGADFDRQIVVKVNAPQVLAAQLRAPRWRREPVALGTNTDPYQRAEGRYRLMPGVIEAFAANATPFSVLTKGTLLARDLPLLVAAAAKVRVELGVSIAMVDRLLSASVEPGTPSPRARLDLVRQVADAGLPCAVLVAPVLPGLTDGVDQLDTLLGEIKAAGASRAVVMALHLRPGAREWYRAWLAREHPDLLGCYDRIYGGGSYADGRYRAWLARRAGPLVRKHGLQHAPGAGAPTPAPTPRPAAEQLLLL